MTAFRVAVLVAAAGVAASCAKVEVVHVTLPASPTASGKATGTGTGTGARAGTSPTTGTASVLPMAEGVFYALPQTVIRAQPVVERSESKAAPFMAYADIFAPGNKPVCEDLTCKKDSVTYALKEGVALSTFGEPDPKHVYMVKFANGRTLDQALDMTWSEAGLVSTASSSVTNRTTDVVMAGVKLAAGIGTRSFGSGNVAPATDATKCPSDAVNNDEWIIATLNGAQMDPTASRTLVANYCALPTARRNAFVEATDRGPLSAARWAYFVRIEPLLNARQQQLTGGSFAENPVPLLERLEGLYTDQLKALYLGTVETKAWNASFDVRPATIGAPEPLLVVDAGEGICVKGTLAPESKVLPAAFKARKEFCDATAPNVTLTATYHPKVSDQLFHVVDQGTKRLSKDLSFRYRIPAQIKAEVWRSLTDGEKKAQAESENKRAQQASTRRTTPSSPAQTEPSSYGVALFPMAQFGAVRELPAKRNAKTFSYNLAFIEATGGLKSFKLGSTGAVEAGTVDAFSGALNSVLDARNTKREKDEAERLKKDAAAAAELDELNILTRKAEILKLKDEICELQKKYGLACETH